MGALVLILVGSGCATQNSTEIIQRLEETGEIPTLDRGPDLAGPDADGNGIRDDIDAYAAGQSYTEPQRAAVKQLARALQAAVVRGSLSQEAALAIDDELGRASDCIWSRFAGVEVPYDLTLTYRAYTANTEARIRAYLQYDQYLDGTVSILPTDEQMEGRCVE